MNGRRMFGIETEYGITVDGPCNPERTPPRTPGRTEAQLTSRCRREGIPRDEGIERLHVVLDAGAIRLRRKVPANLQSRREQDESPRWILARRRGCIVMADDRPLAGHCLELDVTERLRA